VLVLTGAPPAFCAGADLTGVESGAFVDALVAALSGFTQLGIVTMAAVDGPALGAGTQLAIACDVRVATTRSVFGIPAARLGLAIDRWTIERATRELGWGVARGMLLTAETYGADRLHHSGGVHRIGDLDAALAWADDIASLAPLTIAAHKVGLEHAAGSDDGFAAFEVARRGVWASADAEEGRAAFLAKRPADFRGV
jgi:enoyl-CoA hydratase